MGKNRKNAGKSWISEVGLWGFRRIFFHRGSAHPRHTDPLGKYLFEFDPDSYTSATRTGAASITVHPYIPPPRSPRLPPVAASESAYIHPVTRSHSHPDTKTPPITTISGFIEHASCALIRSHQDSTYNTRPVCNTASPQHAITPPPLCRGAHIPCAIKRALKRLTGRRKGGFCATGRVQPLFIHWPRQRP